MASNALTRLALTAVAAVGLASSALAQPHYPGWGDMLMGQDEMPDGMMYGQMMTPERNMPPPSPKGPPEEMMQEMMGKTPHKRVPILLKIIFAMTDTDDDGSLTFEEVSAAQKRIFDAIDTNKDGTITPEEIAAFMQN